MWNNDLSGTIRALIYDFDFSSISLQTLLRELEFKKPQLDELVNTAESLKTDANKLQLQTKGKVQFPLSLRVVVFSGKLLVVWKETSWDFRWVEGKQLNN